MEIYKFQQNAIEQLQKTFGKFWQTDHAEPLEIVLKAPTGSGKTFMTCKFIDSLQTPSPFLPQMNNMAFFWITFSDTLAQQSKSKFEDYFFLNLRNQLCTLADCGSEIKNNSIVFVNWQKLSQRRGKDRLRLRRPVNDDMSKESGYYFDDIIDNTHAAGRKIVMIIDESHTHVDTENSQDLVRFINPKIILKVSATPFKNKADEDAFYAKKGRGFAEIIEVPRADVVSEGLIKEEIICQTEDDLRRYSGGNIDEIMLDLAITRREQIKNDWSRLGQNINPLVLVQLPNDSNEIADGTESKEMFTRNYLKRRGIDETKIITWLADTPLDKHTDITANDNAAEYLLFKYAAGTGWDCPRAHVLVMFREIQSPTFHTQTLGRILRMPVHNIDLSGFPTLRTGYLYTTYARNAVAEVIENGVKNQQKVLTAGIGEQAKTEAVKVTAAHEIGNLFATDAEQQNAESKVEENVKINEIKQKTEQVWQTEMANLYAETTENEIPRTDKIAETKETLKSQIIKTAERTADNGKITEQQKQNINDIVDVYVDAQIGRRDTELIFDPLLKSDFMTRADYGDLGRASDFQRTFKASMNKYFGKNDGVFDENNLEGLQARGVDVNPSLKRAIMVNAHFKFEDDENNNGANLNVEISRNDVEKLFTNACFKVLQESNVGNVQRSWSVLREALRQWFKQLQTIPEYTTDQWYRVFVKDIERETNSIFKLAINKALRDYEPTLKLFLKQREEDALKQSQPFKIKTVNAYTTDFEEYTPSAKSIQQPFYLRKEYAGRANETRFIEYLENNTEVASWLKNGDSGKDNFAIRYYNSTQGKHRLFYPDWLVKYRNGDIGIFDTKGGITADSQDTKEKATALQQRLAQYNAEKQNAIHYIGGIVVLNNGVWLYNDNAEYTYNPNDLNGWKNMNDLMA